MEALTHGPPVLLHAGGLGGRNAERMDHLCPCQAEQPSAAGPCSHRANGAGQMPTAVVMVWHAAAGARCRLKSCHIGHHEVFATHPAAFTKRQYGGHHRTRRMHAAAAKMCVVIIQHMTHLAVSDGGF